MLTCDVAECDRLAKVREIYLRPGGHGKLVDTVCPHHTGRNPGLRMIAREPVPEPVEYTTTQE